MLIIAIETSADETAAALTNGRKVLSNVIYSQILLHKKWGGIYPSLAKRAHEERIDWVVEETLRKFYSQVILGSEATPESLLDSGRPRRNVGVARMTRGIDKIDYIAVTQGPGLAVALEVGIKKAKELAQKYNKKLIAVNHLEGHIYSCFVQNSNGNPKRDFKFPYLALIISGGHTEIVLFRDHIKYQVLGETRDDAAGEALDKAAKMLGLGYPGGPVMERLASEANNRDFYRFPRPMLHSRNLDFSFSGLKTSFYYFLKKNSATSEVKNIRKLASSYQAAVFDTIVAKMDLAIKQTEINRLIVGGGVIANLHLRKLLRNLVRKYKGKVYFPSFKYLTGDNAAMIGVAAYYKANKKLFSDSNSLDRIPRYSLSQF
ncbi:tRNA (adenosine(37)-N6)-threonylcarbamoyltransferase complex transferase subunit TsaD [Candidatus Roizmanbacteria bacterium]|nr:tRNA (adenosine(37)-N6)-threonylcarbamoyltransferase complex transferase subunit TsaD [Candidatus Roizmanbacteria bacterium]